MSRFFQKILRFFSEWWVALILVAAIAIAAGLVSAYARWFPETNNTLHVLLNFREAQAWGQIGDFFGGILNPIIAFCTLFVAVLVWSMQKTELQATRKALNAQAALLEQANRRTEENRNEHVFNMLMEKIDHAGKIAGNLHNKPYEHIQSVNGILWSSSHNHEGNNFYFSSAFKSKNRLQIDIAVEKYHSSLNTYTELVKIALHLIEDKITDKQLFKEIFCAQIGSAQLSLLCLLGCSKHFSKLGGLIQRLQIYEWLPENEKRQFLDLGWYGSEFCGD